MLKDVVFVSNKLEGIKKKYTFALPFVAFSRWEYYVRCKSK